MARTVEQIFNSMIDYKAQQSELNGLTNAGLTNYQSTIQALNNGSKVSVWRLLLFMVAYLIRITEQLWDVFKTEIDEKVRFGVAGTTPWLAFVAKKFQDGYTLQVNADFVPFYPELDTSKQIIKFASAKEFDGNVLLKVAKLSGTNKVPLTAEELNRFTAYIDRIKPAGVGTICRSLAGDLLSGKIEVYYNHLYDSNLVEGDVRAAINIYLSNLDFDGLVFVEKLRDVIQAVAGVNDVKFIELIGSNFGRGSTIRFYDLEASLNNRFYECESGYISADTPNLDIKMF